MPPGRRLRRRKRLQRRGGPRREALTLGVNPVLELRRGVQEEAVEERAGVERDSALQIAPIEGLLELAHVCGQRRGIEA